MRVGDASIPVAQCNNIYIFPGIGLAVTAVRATRITDAMLTAAAAVATGSTFDPGTSARRRTSGNTRSTSRRKSAAPSDNSTVAPAQS